MGRIGKTFALLLTLIIAISCLTLLAVETANAQVGVTNPVVPGFGLMYTPHSWYVSPSYSVDPSTGKAVMTHEGYYKVDRYVELSISNQPFQPYTDSEGNVIDLYYEIRWKPHDSQSWQNLLPDYARLSQNKEFYLTAIPIGFKGNPDPSDWNIDILDYIPNNQYDFQVRALIGYYTAQNQFVGQTSDWANTQTFTVPNDNSTSPTPTVPEFSALAIAPLLLSAFAVAVVVRHRKASSLKQ